MLSAHAAEALPILVVDDDSALIRTLADILRLHGYAPETASSGTEGLALAEANAPALAVVDLRLPDMDGVELAARLHALSDLTQVVVLTGNASVESAVAAMREHSIDYLVKPVQVDRLLQVVSVAGERWQRRRVEERLRQSDERFRRVVESDMLGIAFYHGDATIYDANNAFLRMLRFTRADLAAGHVHWRELARDDDVAPQPDVDGIVAPYETEFMRKDGSRVDVLVGSATLTGPGDGAVSFVLDISDRKRAEHALRERARQQDAVAQFGRLALATTELAALSDEALALSARMLDAPLAALLERRSDGQSLVVRNVVGFDAGATLNTTWPVDERTIAGIATMRQEPVLVRDIERDDRLVRSDVPREHGVRSGIAVTIPGPTQPFGVLEVLDTAARDFSQDDVNFLTAIAHVLGTTADRQRAERAARQSQRMEAVGRLASGVAHDFNNMLSAITGYAELVLQDLPATDARRDDLREILGAADRAAGLTRQLLAFSREQVMRPRVLLLNDVVTGLEKMIRRLIGSEITLTLRLAPELALVTADPGQIEQVLLNLCVNARDAMPAGGRLTIETMNTTLDPRARDASGATDASAQYVMLAVTDTGTGMDVETRARIFEPFFTTKGPEKGTGLGLATVYGIVKQSAGEIFVYSEPGYGTSFKVFLPPSRDAAAPPAAPVPRPRPGPASETIVVAEDEAPLRTILQRTLQAAGYTVLMAGNGAEALELLEAHGSAVPLLVTDMVMPGILGSELARRARERRPDLRVLFLSGFTPATASRDGERTDNDFFLQKPFSSEVLVATLREALDARTAS